MIRDHVIAGGGPGPGGAARPAAQMQDKAAGGDGRAAITGGEARVVGGGGRVRRSLCKFGRPRVIRAGDYAACTPYDTGGGGGDVTGRQYGRRPHVGGGATGGGAGGTWGGACL